MPVFRLDLEERNSKKKKKKKKNSIKLLNLKFASILSKGYVKLGTVCQKQHPQWRYCINNKLRKYDDVIFILSGDYVSSKEKPQIIYKKILNTHDVLTLVYYL